MKQVGIVIILLLSLTSTLLAQRTETTAVPFLLISPDSRSGGYGEGGIAMAGNDPNTIFWNPAGLSRIKTMEVAITHANWLPQFKTDLFYDYLAATYPLGDDLGTIGGHFTFLNLGENIWTDENGNQLGTFKSLEFAAGLSYGVWLDDEWSVGTGVRMIYSKLAPNNIKVAQEKGNGTSVGIGVDLAVEYQPHYFNRLLRVAATITNIGPKMSYVDKKQADPIPTNFRLGASYRILEDEYYTCDLYADMSKLLIARDSTESAEWYQGIYKAWTKDGLMTEMTKAQLMCGGEFVYEKYFSLRMGYFYENKDFGNRKFMTYGAGLKYDFLNVDFSYLSAFEEAHPLSGTVRVSLGLDISQLGF